MPTRRCEPSPLEHALSLGFAVSQECCKHNRQGKFCTGDARGVCVGVFVRSCRCGGWRVEEVWKGCGGRQGKYGLSTIAIRLLLLTSLHPLTFTLPVTHCVSKLFAIVSCSLELLVLFIILLVATLPSQACAPAYLWMASPRHCPRQSSATLPRPCCTGHTINRRT